MQEVQTESQGPESHSKATETMPTKSEQPEPKIEIRNENNGIWSKGKEPVLAKYVRRQYALDHIIGDKLEGTMTRSKLKGTFLLANFEPRSVKDALENKSWIEAMNEEIE